MKQEVSESLAQTTTEHTTAILQKAYCCMEIHLEPVSSCKSQRFMVEPQNSNKKLANKYKRCLVVRFNPVDIMFYFIFYLARKCASNRIDQVLDEEHFITGERKKKKYMFWPIAPNFNQFSKPVTAFFCKPSR